MVSEETLRKEKLEDIKQLGINPYPYSFDKKNSSKEILDKFKKLKKEEKSSAKVSLAGRIMSLRSLGKIAFIHIQDENGQIQLFMSKQNNEKTFNLLKKLDRGDFIGINGTVFRTKAGEITIYVTSLTLLSKSLKPLPEKFHGLKDPELRYRKRYLDLIMNPEVKEVFIKRTKMIDALREFLNQKGFLEVDTPYLQSLHGGAEARPFVTHLNALNIDLYLAISPELYLKRLIVGGYEKVYTIARNFRNEGIDKWHNPEFTMMELYEAYSDYNDMMNLFEDIYEYVCKKVLGTTKVDFQGKKINFKKPWKRMTMAQAIKLYAKIDVLNSTESELLKFAKKNNVEYKYDSWGWLVQAIFEHFCEDKLTQPTFIIDHPKETTPLCKVHRKDPRLIERFEPFCAGAELGNCYSELNDPLVQKEKLEDQQKLLKKGNVEANPYDEDFVNAIEVGMPPTGGMGLGIDRMIMLLTNSDSIRDVLFFPFMRPEN